MRTVPPEAIVPKRDPWMTLAWIAAPLGLLLLAFA
jgi:hypothetical protein